MTPKRSLGLPKGLTLHLSSAKWKTRIQIAPTLDQTLNLMISNRRWSVPKIAQNSV